MQAPAAGRPATIEGERDGEQDKQRGEQQAGLTQRAQFRQRAGKLGDTAVPCGESERRPRRAVGQMGGDAVLQAIAAEGGRAEQGAVETADALQTAQAVVKNLGERGMVGERRRVSGGGALARITPDNRGIKREMVDEERLNAGELRRVIKRAAPTAGNGERATDAGEIERAPRLEAGDDGDAAIEQRKIGKQRDIIAAATGGQHRRGEAADEGDLRQHQRILQHGEHDQQRRRRRHQRER